MYWNVAPDALSGSATNGPLAQNNWVEEIAKFIPLLKPGNLAVQITKNIKLAQGPRHSSFHQKCTVARLFFPRLPLIGQSVISCVFPYTKCNSFATAMLRWSLCTYCACAFNTLRYVHGSDAPT